MNIEVSEYEKISAFELEPITQLCGQNIATKTYVLDSLRRYFSTYKYQEIENKWRDNVKVDGELVGRKYFEIVSVKNQSDIISHIKLTKQSLMMEYIKAQMQDFDFQTYLAIIEQQLDAMYDIVNESLSQMGTVEINYDISDAMDIVQSADITTKDQLPLDNMDGDESIRLFLNLIDKVQSINPRKSIIILENIDHIVSMDEYKKVVERLQEISRVYDIYFILTTSLDGYVCYTPQLATGISIFNDIIYQLPDHEHLINFVSERYPSHKEMEGESFAKIIERIIHRIGRKGYLVTVEENVVAKILNRTLMISDKWINEGNIPENAFLKD